ncbi:MAG TPA: glycosyltransferase family 4 protein [Nitrobacter sp.]|nr:glycosyltransferase family 4 protein [Nitrobacter sp.]
MHVLVISHYFWPEVFRINQLVADLVDRGFDVTVLTGHPNYPEGKFFPGYGKSWPTREWHPAGYEIIRMPVISRGGGGSLRLILNYCSFLVSSILMAPWMLRKKQIDVQFVFCTTPPLQGWIALWIKFLRRAPVIQWVQDMWPESLSSTGHVDSRGALRLIGRALTVMYRASDLVLGQSRSFERMLKPRSGTTPVGYLPNPGDRAQPSTTLEFELPGEFSVVFAGNIGHAQALPTLVEAAELLRDDSSIHFTLFGTGSAMKWLKSEIERRQLRNVTLPGRVPPSAIPGQYAKASALLLTLTAHEAVSLTVPSKLQSYMAAGRPIIVSADGDTAEIIEDAQAGVAAPAENSERLAAAIRQVKSMSLERREICGRNAKAYYDRHFEPDGVANDLAAFLHQTVQAATNERSSRVSSSRGTHL